MDKAEYVLMRQLIRVAVSTSQVNCYTDSPVIGRSLPSPGYRMKREQVKDHQSSIDDIVQEVNMNQPQSTLKPPQSQAYTEGEWTFTGSQWR